MACKCTRCPMCLGSGHIWFDLAGHALDHHMDDLDDMEICEECAGSGISEPCGECLLAEEEDDTFDLFLGGGL